MLKSNYARFDSQIKAMYRDQKGEGWRQGGRVRVEGMEGGPEWDNLPVDLTVTVEGGRQGGREGVTEGWMEGWKEGWREGWKDGWKEGCREGWSLRFELH